MRVITFTSLFPNAKHLSWGIFIFQRMAHFAHRAGNSVVVVAPVPYLPAWLTTSRWKDFAGIRPRSESAVWRCTTHAIYSYRKFPCR